MFPHILFTMLRIDHLSKRYGDHSVFQGLTHTFSPGCVVLSEEENTGKSTLLGLIAGAIPPSAGDIWINGYSLTHSPQQAKAHLAYVPDDCLTLPSHTGRQLLEQKATEKNTSVTDDILDLAYDLGLEPHMDKRFEQMSTGTRRKFFLTAAALGHPAVVVADGPSNGLDSRARTVLAELFSCWGKDRVVLFASYDNLLIEACGAQAMTIAELFTQA